MAFRIPSAQRLNVRLRRIESRLSKIHSLMERLPDASMTVEIMRRSETLLNDLASSDVVREWYTVQQLAERLERSAYTIAEWCRDGRIRAERCRSGHGPHKSWRVSHEELRRYEREGLLPPSEKSETT